VHIQENSTNNDKSVLKPLPMTQLHQQRLQAERESMTKLGINLSNSLSGLVKEEKIRVVQNNKGIRIDIKDSLLFASGSAEINQDANNVMQQISALLLQDDHAIQVEGHTDDTPIHSAQFYSNWELSAVRASSVVRMLSSFGVEENRLSALGFGATQPVSTNDAEGDRAKNRRVSIMILYDNLSAGNDGGTELVPSVLKK
jgi:chemotaxis protein MotB